MDLDLLIEGYGITWPRWLAIAQACERHGVGTLFRTDHYLNFVDGWPERGSLDALGTLAALAVVTTTLRLATLVSPATFRHPSELAKLATTIDHVSGGRFELGLGAGWFEREHSAYGFEYYDLRTRVERLAEQLEVIHGNWAPGLFSFSGKHYQLVDLDAQPKPVQQPHPPLILGGQAGPKVAALAARFADEYNSEIATPDEIAARKARIDAACERAGRESMPVSVMTAVIVGRGEADLRARASRAAAYRGMDVELLLHKPRRGLIVGTIEQVAEQLRALRSLGISRVMCATEPPDDLEFIEILGQELAPLVRSSHGPQRSLAW
jgi:alkanesulfonate monooxygenase SsuD/methylene tetrahydromethanopterin reductase-like flavin-dependent oxidoreductase (luciferase family)